MPANPMHGDLGKLMAGTCVFGKFYFWNEKTEFEKIIEKNK
jgi:hypothetical protein